VAAMHLVRHRAAVQNRRARQHPVTRTMNTTAHPGKPALDEAPIEPARPIVDPHHHLWDHSNVPGVAIGAKPYLLQEFQKTIDDSGHNITDTVYVECVSMYRREGPKDFRPVGETEFANGMAAMAASGKYGNARIVAAIVATANLRLGTEVRPILEAQIAAGNGRLRGLRFSTAYGEAGLFGREADPSRKNILLDAKFRDGVRAMQQFGLSLDVWCLHTQLGELADLAKACPDMPIVLDHLGTPLKFDAVLGASAEVFPQWRSSIVELARRPNVVVKLGGLGMDVTAPIGTTGGLTPSATLATDWRPYVESCIEAFGVSRCMFESNFPVDSSTCSYGALWNAFKRITAAYSEDEKTALFSGTATTCYRLA
jgi:predicted TIM-barrel fold metal-dependent hydrolase